MPKINLTDRTITALKPAPLGTRVDHMDTTVPGFGVRVTDKADAKGKAAQRTFILVARFPGSKNPTRRSLGEHGKLSLEDARKKARQWHELIAKGIDPQTVVEQERAAHRERQANTFGAVAEDFIKRHLKEKRRAVRTEREIRTELIARWRDRPVTEITRNDVVRLIDAIVDRGAKTHAHNIFGHARTIFNWAIDRGVYGLEHSPCDRVRPSTLIGEKAIRTRVLDDHEIKAIWKAAIAVGYPHGPLAQLLILTGGRLTEVAEARWQEFDLEGRRWVVPAARFKSNSEHLVPLSSEAMTVLTALPRFSGYLFSATHGTKALRGFSNSKYRLDALTGLTQPWTFHDLRRTVRTRLSALRVPEPVAEMIIGHAKRGLARVYDQHQYEPEMREALEAWSHRLRDIVEPPPANVIPMTARA
jgi:integrase